MAKTVLLEWSGTRMLAVSVVHEDGPCELLVKLTANNRGGTEDLVAYATLMHRLGRELGAEVEERRG